MIDALASAVWQWASVELIALWAWATSVSRDTWLALLTATMIVLKRDTLFETHAVLSYKVRRAIREALTDREWRRLGSLSESEFDYFIAARNELAQDEFRKADILRNAAEEARNGFGLPGQSGALRRRASKHTERMNTINRETQRLLELKALIDTERAKQSTRVNASGVRKLMANLVAASEAIAVSALMELNRIASRIDWEPFLPQGATATVRSRVLNILRRMAGTNNLGEARNAYSQYQQAVSMRGAVA